MSTSQFKDYLKIDSQIVFVWSISCYDGKTFAKTDKGNIYITAQTKIETI